MSEQVRMLVGLENILVKARRRHREVEREGGSRASAHAARYGALVTRLSDELHSAEQGQLEEYLAYLESTLVPRMDRKVEGVKEEMLLWARRLVDAKAQLVELRHEFTDALDRIRSVRERLGRDPFKPVEVHFGLGTHPPQADRPTRDAHALVKEFLKS